MVISIAAGNQASQLSLLRQTNKFFSNNKILYKKFFTSNNFTFRIRYKYIIITLAEKSTYDDYLLVKKYIEKLFFNKSIGIFLHKDISWLDDINNVTIYKYIV